nr:TonB family protein [Myxococcus sp. MH1]
MLRFRSLSLVALFTLVVAPLALAAAGPRLQAFFQPDLTNVAYQQKVYAQVAGKWKQPGRKSVPVVGRKAVVQAVIGRDGKLVSAVVGVESGSKAWDAAALSAVQKAAPFAPLPADYVLPTLDAHFHVEWTASP